MDIVDGAKLGYFVYEIAWRMKLSANAMGALIMVLAMGTYATSDILYKYVGATLPLHQFLFLRGAMVAILIGSVIAWRKIPAPSLTRDWLLIIARGIVEGLLALTFLRALTLAPVTDLTTILQTVPIVLALVGYVFLGEKFGRARWIAIFAGFIGVLMVVRPSMTGVNFAHVLALISMLLVTCRELVTRALSPNAPSIWAVVVTAFCVSVTGLGGTIVTGAWVALTPSIIGMMCIFSGLISIAYFLSIRAVRMGEVSFVGMFRYAAILFAAIGDIFVFAIFPSVWTLLGCAIIAGSGITIIRREARAKRLEK